MNRTTVVFVIKMLKVCQITFTDPVVASIRCLDYMHFNLPRSRHTGDAAIDTPKLQRVALTAKRRINRRVVKGRGNEINYLDRGGDLPQQFDLRVRRLYESE